MSPTAPDLLEPPHMTFLKALTLSFKSLTFRYLIKMNWIWQLLTSYIGEGNGSPLQYSCLENPVDRGAWWAAVHGVAQSWTRLKRLSMHACIGEGNGSPLQYSCLQNPMDRGAWWATDCGVAKRWTRLNG